MTRTKQTTAPDGASPRGRATARTASTDGEGTAHGCNSVSLGGRVSGAPQSRVLPSGDTVVQLRVVVPRPAPRRGRSSSGGSPRSTGEASREPGRRGAPVDTIDVGVWVKTLQRKALRLEDGCDVVVHGALRRRFWRGAAGPVSRYEVEASAIEVAGRR